MAQEIVTLEYLHKFRLQLLEDLRGLQQPNHSQKAMVKKFRSKKDAWHPDSYPIAIGSHGTLQNLRIKNLIPYQKIGGLMFCKYDDIIKLLEGDKQTKSISGG